MITVPVQFSSEQRNTTVRAAKIAGLEHVELVNEPSASIVEYRRYMESKKIETLRNGMKVLVIDFGGGTLDICCCEINAKEWFYQIFTSDNISVLGNGGNQNLGGKKL